MHVILTSVTVTVQAHTDGIQGLALPLASPAPSFLIGAVIPIDGGATAG